MNIWRACQILMKISYQPSIDSFYGKVSSRGISSENYGHAINVWKVFYIKGIGKYHDFYLKCDVSQLMYVKVLELPV